MLLILNVCEEIHHTWYSLIKRESTWGKCLWLKLWNKAQVSFKGCVCLILYQLCFFAETVKTDFSSLNRSVYPQVKWMFSVAVCSVSLHVCLWFCLSLSWDWTKETLDRVKAEPLSRTEKKTTEKIYFLFGSCSFSAGVILRETELCFCKCVCFHAVSTWGCYRNFLHALFLSRWMR